MPDPEALEADLTRRDMHLQRVHADLSRKATRDLATLEASVLDWVRRIDPTEPARKADQLNRVKRILHELSPETSATYRGIMRRLVSAQVELIHDESEVTRRLARRSGLDLRRGISPNKAKELAERLLIDGQTVAEQTQRQAAGLRQTIGQELRKGVVANETLTGLVTRVRGDRALRRSNGVFRAYERYARTTAATAMGGASNAARFATYEANDDVVEAVQAINPLDSGTSDICRARAGRTWFMRSGKPAPGNTEQWPGPPPWHPGCRTTILPLGRADSPVAGKTFHGFLDSMSEADQREMLGPGKFELWRKGQISMGDLISQHGRPLTVAQLREQYAE
jgi:hypothetical protein